MQRGNYGEERYEKEEFQRKIREKFMELKSRDTTPWYVLDACQSKEFIHDAICDIARQTLIRINQAGSSEELNRLWNAKLSVSEALSVALPEQSGSDI